MNTLKEFADYLEAGGRENQALYARIVEPLKKMYGLQWTYSDPDWIRISKERAKRERERREAHERIRPSWMKKSLSTSMSTK